MYKGGRVLRLISSNHSVTYSHTQQISRLCVRSFMLVSDSESKNNRACYCDRELASLSSLPM